MIGPRARTLTIRTLLAAIGVAAAVYVGVIGAYLGLVLAPNAIGQRARTEALSDEYATLRKRVDFLRSAFDESRTLGASAPLDESARKQLTALRQRVADVTEHSAALNAALHLEGIPAGMRSALATATDSESRCAAVLQEAIDYLLRDDRDHGLARLASADKDGTDMSKAVNDAQRVGLADMAERQSRFGAQTVQVARAAGVWAAVGVLLLTLSYGAIRRWIAVPLGALDAGLAAVARGDLQTPLPVPRNDELGRVTAHFNQMLGMLRVRAEADRSREATLTERLARIIEQSPNAIYLFDVDTFRIVQMNERAQATLGYPADDVPGLSAPDVIGGYDVARLRAEVAPLVGGEREWIQFEARHRRKDGTSFPVEITLQLLAREQPPLFVAIALDATGRQRESTIRHAAQRIAETALAAVSMREVFAAIHAIVGELMEARNFYIALYDPASDELRFPYFVDEAEDPPPPQKAGHGLTEFVLRSGKPILVTPDVFDELARRGEVERVGAPSVDWIGVPLVAEGRTIGVAVVQTYTQGVRYTEEDLHILSFVSGQVAIAIARRHAEEQVRESRDLVERFTQTSPVGITVLDRHGRITFANEQAARLLGVSRTEIRQRAFDAPQWRATRFDGSPIPPEELPFSLVMATGQAVFDVGHGIEWPDGRRVLLSVNGAPLLDAAGTVEGVVATFEDVTEREELETQLRRSEEQYRTLVDGVKDLIFSVSLDGRITSLNPAFEDMTGFARWNWLGRPFVDLVHAEDAPRAMALIEAARAGEPRKPITLRVRSQRGRHRVGELHTNEERKAGVVVGVLGIVRDVTDRVQLEEQFREAQKLETVGRLAGGVAHDFNNLLTVILGFASQARDAMDEHDPAWRDLGEVEEACTKAASLTRQLLAFARRQVSEPRALVLSALMLNMDRMLRRVIGEHIELVTLLGEDLWTVWADPNQIEQVLMNLAVNARDAMPLGGKLTIETANEAIEGEEAAERAGVPEGEYVRLSVSDTGHGMSPEVAKLVFEPFFTTKKTGVGTGLGLSTCYGIIKQAGGWINVTSEEGRGASFAIHLPRSHAAAGALVTTASRPVPAGSESVLLVEDDAKVRDIAARSLRDRGYQVTEAANGAEALRTVSGRIGDFDLVITDVVMPQMGGRELAERLLALRPDLRILYTSGYAEDVIAHGGVLDHGLAFLTKPYDPSTLARKVREVLDERRV